MNFWSQCRRAGGSSCWEWAGKLDSDGYGLFFSGGRKHRAHRFAYELAKGPVPDGQQVCHHCDNPRCIRPLHLWCGSAADNQHDKVSKGRQAKGEQNGRARLTEHDVARIRERLGDGASLSRLARDYRMSVSAIWRIRHSRGWKHVAANDASRAESAV